MYIQHDISFLQHSQLKDIVPLFNILPPTHTLIVLFKSPKPAIQYNSGYRIYSIPKDCDRVIYTKVDPTTHLITILEIWNTSNREIPLPDNVKSAVDEIDSSNLVEDTRPIKTWIMLNASHPEEIIAFYECKTITSAEAYFKRKFQFEFSGLEAEGLLRIRAI